MKIVTSIIWAFIVSALWKWTHGPCDWYYIWIIGFIACAGANIVWEYLLNKTEMSNAVIAKAKSTLSAKAVKVLNI